MSLLAAFDILLHLATGQDDVRVGTLVAGRHRRELEGLIGFFVDLVVLRTDLGGDPTLREVRHRVRATTLAASAHPDLPFEELARTLERERGLARSALCQVMLVLNPPLPRFDAAGLRLHGLEVDSRTGPMPTTLTPCDLVLLLREGPEGLAGHLVYNTALFDASTIAAMCERFRDVLEGLVATPERRLSDYRRRDCR
jgi:non-ribosomal peptide synthetase component F